MLTVKLSSEVREVITWIKLICESTEIHQSDLPPEGSSVLSKFFLAPTPLPLQTLQPFFCVEYVLILFVREMNLQYKNAVGEASECLENC